MDYDDDHDDACKEMKMAMMQGEDDDDQRSSEHERKACGRKMIKVPWKREGAQGLC